VAVATLEGCSLPAAAATLGGMHLGDEQSNRRRYPCQATIPPRPCRLVWLVMAL
jgi:hypothetical protein